MPVKIIIEDDWEKHIKPIKLDSTQHRFLIPVSKSNGRIFGAIVPSRAIKKILAARRRNRR